MSEWWTYRLRDFLLFSPRTYFRLFELYNAAIWPAQLVALGLGVWILLLLRRPSVSRGRWLSAILAASWLWVAVAFHMKRYTTINWTAVYFGWGFALEAALWTGLGVFGRLTWTRPPDLARRVGLGLFVFALALEPCVGLLFGREWRQGQILGVAPDPTAVATLGVLLAASGRGRGVLAVIPALWCAVSFATLLAIMAPEAWMMAAVGIVAATAVLSARRQKSRHNAARSAA
ncbi:MAG TPA: DUF6064 family protein [Thermoanaerobaculia bacterium]